MDRVVWQATVHGIAKSQTKLSDKIHNMLKFISLLTSKSTSVVLFEIVLLFRFYLPIQFV